jgi:antirestriction protein ArdC
MSSKKTVYSMVTDRIMALLKAGVVPWHRPWNVNTGRPHNLVSRRAYTGINVLLLGSQSYGSPCWLTMKQANQLGGHIRKGERSTPVVFWKQFTVDDATGDAPDATKTIPLLRFYRVFNVLQTEGVEVPSLLEADHTPTPPMEACEALVAGMPAPPAMATDPSGAYYNKQQDTVYMPRRCQFESPEAYYSTLFHELTHSTGHATRLDRSSLNDAMRFGDTNYSKEELIAEMGAAFLCGIAGIENATINDTASYIKGWLARLRHDKRVLVHAAGAAQCAADYICGHLDDHNPQTDMHT